LTVRLRSTAQDLSTTRLEEVLRMPPRDDLPIMYVDSMDGILNRWFTRYEQARASLESEGGYLFPYRNQFFVTLREGVVELGLDPDDPDWERIGFDWVRPADADSWSRLAAKRRAVK
jgi:hypothetical protein